jgi:mRNA-degrading endonuclease RelE of RelBE toxin-antitoxin system
MPAREDLPLLEFASKAERDLRKIVRRNRPDAESIRDGLAQLRAGASNIDTKQVRGHPPWWRLRVGDWRVLFRKLERGEVAELCRARKTGATTREGYLVFRIVNRADLERAVDTLPT